MKNFLKNYSLYVLIIGSFIFLFNITKSFYIGIGREQVESEFNDKMLLHKIETEKQFEIKDELLSKAVEEKLTDRENHHKEIRVLKKEHLNYRDKVRLEFQNVNLTLSKLRITNKNLKMDLLDVKALNLSLSTINKNLILYWNLSDNKILRDLDKIMKESIAETEQKYINFINKIDKIKKGKK